MTPDEMRDAIANGIADGFKTSNKAGTTTGGGGGTNAVKKSADALGGIFKDFGKQINAGGGRLSEVAGTFDKNLGKLAKPFSTVFGTLSSGIGYLEETTDQFRRLAKVGGGAEGSLGALRAQAGRANLSLDQFASLVERNSTALVGFGGGVEGGQRKVAELGQALFDTGIVDRFQALGYTIEEANDFVLKNTMLTRRQAMLEGMTSQQQVSSAAALAKNMTIMAKLTGKDVQALQDEIVERSRAGSTQAALRLLEMDGITNATETFNSVQAILSAGSKNLQNSYSELTENQTLASTSTIEYAAVQRKAIALAAEAERAQAAGDKARAEHLARMAVAAEAEMTMSREGLQVAKLARYTDVGKGQADVLEQTGDVIDGIQAEAKKMGIALNTATGYMSAFGNALNKITTQVEQQQFGRGQGQDARKMIDTAERTLAETAGDINEAIGTQIDSNSKLVGAFQTSTTAMDQLGNKMLEGVEKLQSLLPGGPQDQIAKLNEKVGDKVPGTDTIITQDHVQLLIDALDPLKPMADRIDASEILQAQGIIENGVLKTSILKIDPSSLSSTKGEEGTSTLEEDIGKKPAIEKIKDFFGGFFAEGGELGAGQFGVVGEGGGMQHAELLTGPATITPMASMANAFSNQFSQISAQLANELSAVGAPMTQAAQEFMATKQGEDTAMDPAMSSQMNKMKEQMKELQSGPDLIQMMQQLIEINRKTMEATKKHYNLSNEKLGGI